MKAPKEATLGEYDIRGAFAPESGKTPPELMETFSLGVFRWVPRRSGKGLKPGRVLRRFRAPVDEPDRAYRAAHRWIDAQRRQLNLFEEHPSNQEE